MSKNRGGRQEEVDLQKFKRGLPPGPPPNIVVKKFNFRPVATIIPERDEAAETLFAENKAAVEAGIRDYVAELRRLQEAATASPDNFAIVEQMEAVEAGIKDILNRASQPVEGGSRAIGLAALLAFAQNLVSTCWTEKYWGIDASRRLTAAGFITQCEEGKKGTEVLGRDYRLTEDFQKIPAAQQVLRDLQQIGVIAGQVAREDFESALAQLKAEAGETPLSVAELKAGKSGRIILYLPTKEKEEDGRTKHFAGGHLLLESDGTAVRLISVVGGASKFAEELISGGTTVKVSYLGQQPPPTLPGPVQKLAYWLRDSIVHAEAEASKVAEEAKWQETETREVAELNEISNLNKVVSAEEFFLRQRAGQLIVRFGATRSFDQKGKDKEGKETTTSYRALSALVERRVDGAIKLVACPDRLRPLFAGCADYTQPEENFKGLCVPLAVCLRAEFGRAQKAAAEAAVQKAVRVTSAAAVKAESVATAKAMLAAREPVVEEQPALAPAAPAKPAELAPEPAPPAPAVITEDQVWAAMIADGEMQKREAYQAALVLEEEGRLKKNGAVILARLRARMTETRLRLEAEVKPKEEEEEDPFFGEE